MVRFFFELTYIMIDVVMQHFTETGAELALRLNCVTEEDDLMTP